jgi:PEP-CTERM motif
LTSFAIIESKKRVKTKQTEILMNTISKTLTAFSLSAIAIFALNTNSSAQTLSALDGGAVTLNVNTIPTTMQGPSNSGSTGTDGSYFFDVAQVFPGTFTGDLSNLPTYVTSVAGFAESDSGADSQITVGGTTYFTGISFDFANDPAPLTLATITLGSSIPASFNLGLLSDNSYQSSNAFYSLALFNSSNVQLGSTLAVNSTITGDTHQNDFYYANVQGAGAGDYIKVYAAGTAPTPGVQVSLGGVTFDTVTTPEPTTWALMFAGLGVLVLVARRKVSATRL